MGQNIKHRKLLRRRSASFNRDVPLHLSNKEGRPQPYSAAYAATLSHIEECQYLHRILAANLPCYSAKMKLRRLQDYMPKSWPDAKNHNLLTRLTAKGMVLLKTRYANKPKNPE